MSYNDLFTRYGNPSKEAEIKIWAHLIKPENIDELKRVEYYDKTAEQLIKNCQQMIADMQEYRQALAHRYASFVTMSYKLRLELERRKDYNGKVYYYIKLLKIHEDGTTIKEIYESYNGAERHEALKRFEELKKSRPGIEAIKNIEKSKWEK